MDYPTIRNDYCTALLHARARSYLPLLNVQSSACHMLSMPSKKAGSKRRDLWHPPELRAFPTLLRLQGLTMGIFFLALVFHSASCVVISYFLCAKSKVRLFWSHRFLTVPDSRFRFSRDFSYVFYLNPSCSQFIFPPFVETP